MKVSRTWLQRFFENSLPSVTELADALTFHAFEIEETEGDVLDVKVLPDRAGYALSHRGIAKEIAAIASLPLSYDPLRAPVPELPPTNLLTVTVDERYVLRHLAALVEGVVVKPSPQWLREALESVGQRSINNIVDATNFVMLNIGQPMHAFDADYIKDAAGKVHLDIRAAKNGEKVTTLSGDEYALHEHMYVISNGKTGEALDIAGVKGGVSSGVQSNTTNLVLSVGTYDGELVRKTCQRLGIHTDASQRYQNRPSPDLGGFGMRDIVSLVIEVAGGKLVGGVDVYPVSRVTRTVSVSAEQVSRLLGASYADNEVASVLARLDLPFTKDGSDFVVTPPFERTDLVIAEDLIEEVGRLIGYDRIQPLLLPVESNAVLPPYVQGVEMIRDCLVAKGCIEISSYSMVREGDVALQKPLAEDKGYLRPSLYEGHREALNVNAAHMPLFNLSDVRLFEIGKVWPQGKEVTVLGVSYWSGARDRVKKRDVFFADIEAALSEVCRSPVTGVVKGDTWQCNITNALFSELPTPYTLPEVHLDQFTPFSNYPYALRDIAVWTPLGTTADMVHARIQSAGGGLLVRSDLHDVFTKNEKTSFMYKLVLQANDRTLTDADITLCMQKITDALNAEAGYTVR